ncbi:GNAT family N-acetyltransferase [Streptomyces sp. MA15]|uniref:GNAT family N-acetyltransferase n=1 Tax=Streptomyces sp. MA15 TaxID=3055061 RepID=UPI0025AF6FF5|nr:GNAT family N-acetyltransferase [Streptomyces sp. MA15]MDN3266374.1 GNAT family N-acetyltransferase [Streptomyces sp. MA15]
MSYKVRSLRVDEWPRAKALRLEALRDPVAPIAFMETYESAAARPDSFWRDRAERSAEGATGAQQIIAEGPDGEWVGTLTVLMEEPGATDWAGLPVERLQGHLVAVYVQPGHRGIGLTEVLFDAGLEWAWVQGAERVRLLVHEDNARALRAYRRAGFAETGVTTALGPDAGERELELAVERPDEESDR